MSPLWDLKEGDSVVVLDANYRPRTVHITKVGRTNLYIGKSCYDRGTGHFKGSYGNASLITVEEHALRTKVETARSALRAVGVELDRKVTPDRVLSAFEVLREWIGMDPKTSG